MDKPSRGLWLLLVQCVWLSAAVAVGPQGGAREPAAPGPVREGHDYRVVVPDELWRAERWPLVAVLAAGPTDLKPLTETYAKLTRPRGALLVVLPGGDEVKLQSIVNSVAAAHPVDPQQVILLGRDAMASFAWRQMMGHSRIFAGFVAIDCDVDDAIEPVPGQLPNTPGRAVLLVLNRDRLPGNHRLFEAMRRWGMECNVPALTGADQEKAHLAAALTAVLPPSPARSTIADPNTRAGFRAPDGWQFERRDGYFAIARRADEPSGAVVEIQPFTLGKLDFEKYVTLTAKELQQPGLETVENERVTPDDAPTLVHAFRALDRRGEEERSIYWLLVGEGDRMVSLRAVAPTGMLSPHLEAIRQMALGVTFGERR
jgi:hypothetical protein